LKATATSSDFGIADEFEDYETYFKQLFCVATYDLANSILSSLENIDVLFGEILSTYEAASKPPLPKRQGQSGVGGRVKKRRMQ